MTCRLGFVRASYLVLISVLLAGCQSNTIVTPFRSPSPGRSPSPSPGPAGQLSVSPSTQSFAGTGATYNQSITVTSTIASSTITVTPSSGCGTGANALVTFGNPSSTDGLNFTIVETPQKVGTCTVTFSGTSGGSATLTVTVNTATVTTSGYVSPNSTQASITVVTVDGTAPTTTQVPVNPTTVQLASPTSTIPLPAPTGTVAYLIALEDNGGHVLSRNTVTFTVMPAVANTFTAQLDGVVAHVTTVVPTLQMGTAFSGPITVNASDASGALISGNAPFANAFTLTDNDNSGHSSLTDGATTALTVTDLSPNDVVILNYDGAGPTQITITATIPPP